MLGCCQIYHKQELLKVQIVIDTKNYFGGISDGYVVFLKSKQKEMTS